MPSGTGGSFSTATFAPRPSSSLPSAYTGCTRSGRVQTSESGTITVSRSTQSMRSRSAIGRPLRLPVPEPADRDAGEAFLVRLERLLLALGDQERHRRIGEGRARGRRDVEPGWRARALVVADRVALAVADRREELAPDELVRTPHRDAMRGAVVGEDEDVPDLVDEPGAQQSRQIAGRRRVETGRGDRRVGEARPPQVLDGLRVGEAPASPGRLAPPPRPGHFRPCAPVPARPARRGSPPTASASRTSRSR